MFPLSQNQTGNMKFWIHILKDFLALKFNDFPSGKNQILSPTKHYTYMCSKSCSCIFIYSKFLMGLTRYPGRTKIYVLYICHIYFGICSTYACIITEIRNMEHDNVQHIFTVTYMLYHPYILWQTLQK